jgi:hypothetical protein
VAADSILSNTKPATALSNSLPHKPLCSKKPYSKGSQELYYGSTASFTSQLRTIYASRVQVAQVIVTLPAAALTDFLPYTPLCPKKPYSRGSQALDQSHSESYEPTSRAQVTQALRVIRLTWAPRYISIAALEYAYHGWISRVFSFVFWPIFDVSLFQGEPLRLLLFAPRECFDYPLF